MDLTSALDGIGMSVLEARKNAGIVEVIDENGMPHCKKCGEPLKLELKFTGQMAERLGEKRFVPRNCECMRTMFAEEYKRHDAWERMEAIKRQRNENLKAEKYRVSTFDKDDGRSPAIRKTCERYVMERDDVIKSNMGLAFLGGNGGGKTFWAACIANAMIDAGATVYMTTLTRLIRDMNANHGENREPLERKIKNVDFLILDDYGAERGTEYSLEQAFEIIDTRYSVSKPLIITANLTEEILRNPPAMNYGRSYSRILEMCPAIIKVKGERRSEIAAEKRKALLNMLFKEE